MGTFTKAGRGGGVQGHFAIVNRSRCITVAVGPIEKVYIEWPRVVGICCVHYIEQKYCTAGLMQGVYERFLIKNLIRPDCTGEGPSSLYFLSGWPPWLVLYKTGG